MTFKILSIGKGLREGEKYTSRINSESVKKALEISEPHLFPKNFNIKHLGNRMWEASSEEHDFLVVEID